MLYAGFFFGERYAGFSFALDEINYIVSCSINFCCNSWMNRGGSMFLGGLRQKLKLRPFIYLNMIFKNLN